MTAGSPDDMSSPSGRVVAESASGRSRDPAALLNSAMISYIFVNLVFALPLAIFPVGYFEVAGFASVDAAKLGGLRWLGAALLAWAISGILVLARPEGRAIFVTTGALQLTLAAVAFVYSWYFNESEWSTWYRLVVTAILITSAAFMWWVRFRARTVLRSRKVH